MKKIVFGCGLALAAMSFAGSVPSILVGTATQDDANRVHIPYALSGGPAIVTLNVLTNDGSGAYAAMDALGVFGPDLNATSGANTPVVGDGAHEIVWKPRKALGDSSVSLGQTKFELKAYAVNHAPAYMAVRLAAGIGAADRVFYFAGTNALPGGVLGNANYRRNILLLKRVQAKNRMAYGADSVTTVGASFRAVSFTNDYYMGVFELTQQQWLEVYGSSKSTFATNGAMRPAESASYREIREAADNSKDVTHMYPAAPHPDSYLGKLRALTRCAAFPDGIDFDLPSENEWEYAARANMTDDCWTDGTPILDTEDSVSWSHVPGRYYYNQKNPSGSPATSVDTDNATAVCGSYAPNGWGFYDFQGNVAEFCLDWYEKDLSSKPLVFVNADGESLLNGTVGSYRMARGGAWNTHCNYCEVSRRDSTAFNCISPDFKQSNIGFRLKARAGLK